MLASILASGLAAGAIYALVGVTYNTMFSTSRVMSFTAGQLAMLGGVFGSMFTLKLGMPAIAGLVLTLIGCALIGIITEFVAVRPVLKSLDQHLYVLSTLAVALMIQQVAAIKWGTEPQPFPRLIGWGTGVTDEKFWLPVVACAITILGLDLAMRHPDRVDEIFAFAANTVTSGVKAGVEKNPTFAAFIERAGHEYEAYSATPKQYDVFVAQISKMWASQPNWTDAQLKAITAPVLVVDGDHDEAIKREHTDYIASTIPRAGLLILPNASHFAFLQDPELFNYAVLHFLGDR